MRCKLSWAAWRLALPVLTLWLGGCCSVQSERGDAAKIFLESHAASRVYVAWSDTHVREGSFFVTGVLRRGDVIGPPIKACVEVEIVSPCGSIWDRAQSNFVCVPHRKVNRVQGFERFCVRFAKTPPAGSSVRLTARHS